MKADCFKLRVGATRPGRGKGWLISVFSVPIKREIYGRSTLLPDGAPGAVGLGDLDFPLRGLRGGLG